MFSLAMFLVVLFCSIFTSDQKDFISPKLRSKIDDVFVNPKQICKILFDQFDHLPLFLVKHFVALNLVGSCNFGAF